MGKQSIASYIMFVKRLQRGDEGDVTIDVDDGHAGGGWSHPEAILAAFPPSELLQQPNVDPLFMCF